MTLRCACLEGLMTDGEHHEAWCPVLMGDYSGLPVLDPSTLDERPKVDDDEPQ